MKTTKKETEKTCFNCKCSYCPNAGKNKPANTETINGFTWIHICAHWSEK